MSTVDYGKLAQLSPFELKDQLMSLASSHADRMMLNAGRGNPNFLATIPRHGFFQLGLFALQEAERSFAYMPEGIGGHPREAGLEARFRQLCGSPPQRPRRRLPQRGGRLRARPARPVGASDFLHEMTSGILACNYPVPPRMLALTETVVRHYLVRELIGGRLPTGGMDLFAVEGGTAAMTYIFNTMRENRLLAPGDKIAIGMPIFTPYIEIPHLNDYQLVEVLVNADSAGRLAISGRRARQAGRSGGQGVLPGQPQQSAVRQDRRRRPAQDRRHRRQPAAGPGHPDGRCLRHVRRRLRIAVRDLPAQHHPGLLVLEIFRRHRLAAGRHCDAP